MSTENNQKQILELKNTNNLIIDHKDSMFTPEEPSPTQTVKRAHSPTEELEEISCPDKGKNIKYRTDERMVPSNDHYRTSASSSNLRQTDLQQNRLSHEDKEIR